jgi:hypothetical protein
MSLNYRVVKTITKIPLGDTDISYGIHEVYYDESGEIVNISESLAYPISDDLEGLRWNLEKMLEACKKPVIDYKTKKECVHKPNTPISVLAKEFIDGFRKKIDSNKLDIIEIYNSTNLTHINPFYIGIYGFSDTIDGMIGHEIIWNKKDYSVKDVMQEIADQLKNEYVANIDDMIYEEKGNNFIKYENQGTRLILEKIRSKTHT